MKKFLLSLCAVFLLICCIFITDTDVKADCVTGYYPSITLKVPKMSQYPNGCGIACMGQGEGYFFDQTDRTYSSSKVYSLVSSYNKDTVSANWGYVGYLKKGATSEAAYLKDLYQQLATGYPAIVFRRSDGGGTHYATVYAYTGSTTSLTRDGFQVVSTNQSLSYVSRESLSTFLKNATPIDVYDGTYPDQYKYIVRRSGIPNPSSLVSGITFAINHPPAQHKQNTTQPVLGTISSNYNLTSVTVGVYDLNGNKKFAASATPNAKYYNINKLDGSMTFKSLPVGDYDYKVVAKDANGATKTYTWRFKVVSAASTSTTITFTYNPVGATGTIPAQTVNYGESITVASGDHLVRAGHTLQGFAGYRCSDKTYYTNGGYKWQTQEQINANGYTKKAYQSGTSYKIDNSWTTNPQVDNQFIFAAIWKANTYTIKYDANGGNGTMADGSVTYGKTSAVAQNAFANAGCTFSGWNVYSESLGEWLYTNGTTEGWYAKGQQPTGYSLAIYDAGDSLSHVDTVDGDVLRLTATWIGEFLSLPFIDVEVGSWYYEPVEFVYYNNLMTGMRPMIFGPYENLSRAQFAVILHRMNGAPDVDYRPIFPDVADGTWYTDAVLWANENGIITGYANGYFGAADNITREQMALMMYRYANAMNCDTSIKADFISFKDAKLVSSFARDAMKWAVGNGIITGKENGTMLDPQGNASRAECATIIMRFANLYTA